MEIIDCCSYGYQEDHSTQLTSPSIPTHPICKTLTLTSNIPYLFLRFFQSSSLILHNYSLDFFTFTLTHKYPNLHTILRLCHTILRQCHAILRLCHTILRLFHTIHRLCHTILRLFHTILPLFETILPLCHTILRLCHTILRLCHTILRLLQTNMLISRPHSLPSISKVRIREV